MDFFDNSQKEVTKIAAELLKWELPLTLTQSDLDKIRVIANSAITHSHDVLNMNIARIVIKPKISIDDIARFNKQKKSLG
jgi:hypothetical protein